MSTLNPYVVTFNCGRQPIDPSVFSTHLFSALANRTAPDILILCLQEIAPIAYSFLGGSYLVPYLSPFRHAITTAAASLDGASYVNIITRNIGMTATMVFVLRDQTSQIRWLETATVGVGLYEMGNKGAVGVRMGYSIGDSTLEFTFVSAHLAPMEDKLQRRNEDWKNIVRGLVFTPVSLTATRKNTAQRLPQESSDDTEPLLQESPGEDSIPPMSGLYTPTSHLIFAGDLNYRTSSTKPSPEAQVTWPQPSNDPDSKQHYSQLLPSDQLKREMQAGKTCHGLQEAAIDFPPTYKYSDEARSTATSHQIDGDEAGSRWEWAKHRWPSWCDRVLYLDMPPWVKSKNPAARVQVQGYRALPLMASSDHRPVACSFSISAEAIPEPSEEEEEERGAKLDVRLVPPFDLNPLWMEQREAARTKEVMVGIGAYLGLTWEGRGILLAMIFGALGGWAAIRSLLQ